MTKQLHHSLKGDLSSEHQFSEAKASFVKGVQSRLELGGLCMFLIHISITGGGNRGLLSLVYLFPAVFPCIRVCQAPSIPFRQSSFPRGTAPEGSCSLPGQCTGMGRLEKTGASGSPSAPPEERPFPSLQSLGIGRAIRENLFF